MAVNSPATPMERLLMAPWTSPISMALEVPSAWLAVPMATPCATLCLMRQNLQTAGAATAPVIPVIVMAMMVMEGMPPICSEHERVAQADELAYGDDAGHGCEAPGEDTGEDGLPVPRELA